MESWAKYIPGLLMGVRNIYKLLARDMTDLWMFVYRRSIPCECLIAWEFGFLFQFACTVYIPSHPEVG